LRFSNFFLHATQILAHIHTMTLTNFHNAAQLLARAGSTQELQAMIQPFQSPLYVNYTSVPQETINQYSWRLQNAHLDQWVCKTEAPSKSFTISSAPEPVRKVPKLCVSHAFKNLPHPSTIEDPSKDVDFIFLVEGNRGATCLKLVLQHDSHGAGVTFFHEAMNGYSVVFSGVVSKKAFQTFLVDPMNRILNSVAFKRVESVEELLEMPDYDPNERSFGTVTIPIFC
jgi:hypothetical protein